MKNTKILICILGALLLCISTSCKKDDITPKADMEEGMVGFWFKLNDSYTLIEDVD